MVIEKKFNSISEISALQRIASMADKEVYLSNQEETIKVDARSFIGLFALDFSQPLKVITDSLYVIRMIEMDLRKQSCAAAVR
ncbi:hypothetical protein INF37_13210 [Pseudoflavonifractor sp. DSM 107456]|uniref:RNase H type-1 domain-containing protein n=2 Tax=Pseudoflavonifractor TaxID=1017280 RepID=A0ABR9RE27_9FIRM|nr:MULTISPECIES: hypothetical protein [Eubacteriales]MBC5731928.1 hypothetical protein [Pseudoflavonifractor hominis]MBE5056946.1 hypothetical protein [Pseudoflavonifractor gallinarum]MBS5134904.1 hypothetical protein [Oscillospiraceae bacterium]MBT9683895.1 hypothetical protein [Pseudoflavonifractor sp. MCC625]